jgi:hypothetical protein
MSSWYAVARWLKPAKIIETGIHDGLGTLLFLRAIERNREEGGPDGRLIGFDIDHAAGWIVGSHPNWTKLVQSSRPALEGRVADVDLFLHDSLHDFAHERWELETAAAAMSDGAVLISDNTGSPMLEEISVACGYRFGLFVERPLGHFYQGAGFGIARPG